ncbi:hypothetical protein BCV70DRAFT_179306, partial [Testicularia cyperi]
MLRAIFSSGSAAKKTQSADTSTSATASSTTSSPSGSPKLASAPLFPPRTTSSVMSSWAVPPFPHPLPERRIGLLVTDEGLLVFPKSSAHHKAHNGPTAPHHVKSKTTASTSSTASQASTGASSAAFASGTGLRVAAVGNASAATINSSPTMSSAVSGGIGQLTSLDVGFLVKWSKEAKLEPMTPAMWRSLLEQYPVSDQLECSGIIGITKMFSSSYLFVVTSSKLVGHYFHASRPIYCCTGVLAIPLLQPEASQAIKAQIAKSASVTDGTVSAQASEEKADSSDEEDDGEGEDDDDDDDDDDEDSDFDDVETPAAIPREPFFSQPGSAIRSETLRMPKSRPWLTKAARAVSDGRLDTADIDLSDTRAEAADATDQTTETVDVPASPPSESNAADASAQAAAASPPSPENQWHAAKQAELEEKAVRETAKHFARGEFWFAYDFDLTTSLQKKHDALAKSPAAPTSPKGHSATLSTSSTASTLSAASAASAASQKTAPSKDGPTEEFVLLEEPYANLPLWRRADRRFWHNEHLCKDLIHAGLHAYILPVMQGYLQTVELPIAPLATPEAESVKDQESIRCQMMVISRRSKERAGLRYQRRGINEAGQVANYVETEQIVYVMRTPHASSSSHLEDSRDSVKADVMSFVQFRGSIPLFWSQSPFSLKPPPVLERGSDENLSACRRHFTAQLERFTNVICINLAEQAGKEGQISHAYKSAVNTLAESEPFKDHLEYVDFDFHKECAGMKFENVNRLILAMHTNLDRMRYFHLQLRHRLQQQPTQTSALALPPTSLASETKSRQSAAFRVSCLDCLDRTNVVQSAFARHVLAGQLQSLGIAISS